MITSNVTTITLDGSETIVEFEKGYPYYWITNRGSTDISVSMSPGITPKAEGVYTISGGASERIGTGYELHKFYILGSGEAYIRGETIAAQPSFKKAGKGGDITCTQHITDGLIISLSTAQYNGYAKAPTNISLPLPNTIEICGYYTEIPSSSRWFEARGGGINLIVNQYGNKIDIHSHGSWISEYPEDAVIEPNENVTLSIIYEQQSLKVYKNGVLVLIRDDVYSAYPMNYLELYFLRGSGSNAPLNGEIYNIRVYDRELAEDEILQNVAADKKLYFKEV